VDVGDLRAAAAEVSGARARLLECSDVSVPSRPSSAREIPFEHLRDIAVIDFEEQLRDRMLMLSDCGGGQYGLAQSRVPNPVGCTGDQQGQSRKTAMVVVGQAVRYEDPFAMPFNLNPSGE
jgi:hypothetical protein